MGPEVSGPHSEHANSCAGELENFQKFYQKSDEKPYEKL
jgi:hypothetical protein